VTGLFLTFEGTEGAGKSTQLDRLERWLLDRGHEPLRVREPGGTALGEKIRAVLLDRASGEMAAWTELCLYVASRAQLVAERIRPALEAGRIVLADRYGDASIAYQGGGRRLGARRVASLNAWATAELRPDRVFLFDLDPRIGLTRIRTARGEAALDRLEVESLQFHQRVRRAYLSLARREAQRYRVLDARLAPDELARLIESEVAPLLDR